MMCRFLLCLISLIACAAGSSARAADFTDKLSHIEKTVSENQQQAKLLEQKTAEQGEALKTLRQQLVGATENFERKQAEQKLLQDKQDTLAADIVAKNKALGDGKRKLSALVTAMIEIVRQPPQALILQEGPTRDYIHRILYMRSMLPRATEMTESLGKDLVELHSMKEQLARQEKLTEAASANLKKQRQKLDQLVQMRQGILQKSEAQKAEIQKQLVALSSEANDLRQLLQKVSPQSSKPVPQMRAPSKLKWPVVGQQTKHFGDRDSDGVKSQGIAFAALSGAPVVAPAAGKVVFAGNFKGYGPIVILQHAGGYHSFMAGFGRIDADMGEEVEMGEPLGVMPLREGSKPELYFEWRHNSEPVDPIKAGGS